MNHKEQEKLKTSDRAENFYLKNKTVLDTFLGIKKDFEANLAINVAIRKKLPLQSTDQSGNTTIKETDKIILVKAILKNTGPACSCFDSLGDTVNFNKIIFKEYLLLKDVPAELNANADIAIAVLTENILALGDYGITVASIAEITTAKIPYAAYSNLPEELRTASTVNTKGIKTLFVKLTHNLKVRLTNSMLLIRDSHPDLYELFMALVRNLIIGTHTHHDPAVVYGTVDLTVKNAATGERIPNVSVKTVGVDLVTLSNDLGMLEIELPIGTYVIKFVTFDFQEFQISVTVTEDDQSITVQLTPLV